MSTNPLVMLALVAAVISAVVLVWYLLRRPPLGRPIKIVLLFAIGVLPIATAMTGNVAGYQATKSTEFCTGSCHVMGPYGSDIEDPTSESLAARHSRNAAFGSESCYACHADYGMFGTVTTKIGGMRHVYEYLFHYRSMPIEQSLASIELVRPFRNDACVRCHSMQNPLWAKVGDHASTLEQVRAGELSCASGGCHGYAHPFSRGAAKTKAPGLLSERQP